MRNFLKNLFNHKPHAGSRAVAASRQWESRSRDLLEKFKRSRTDLESLQSQIQSLSLRLEQQLREAEQLEEQHRTVVEALRSENEVMGEITIPTLVSQHKLIQQRIEEETAISVMRQTATNARGRDEG